MVPSVSGKGALPACSFPFPASSIRRRRRLPPPPGTPRRRWWPPGTNVIKLSVFVPPQSHYKLEQGTLTKAEGSIQ
jgi:hypothetical protein